MMINSLINRISVRSLLYLCVLSAACARLPQKVVSALPPSGGCELYVATAPVTLSDSDTQRAVHDFENRTGFPYSALYVERSGGRPDRDKCLRVCQRPDGRFTFYSYAKEHVDSSVVRAPQLAVALAHVGQGHFASLCTNEATEAVSGALLVKQGRTVAFSILLSLHERKNFTGADQARVDSALHVIYQLANR